MGKDKRRRDGQVGVCFTQYFGAFLPLRFTVLRGGILPGDRQNAATKFALVRAFIPEKLERGQNEDFEIEPERPVFDVIEVVFGPFGDRSVTAQAVDLRPAGDAQVPLIHRIRKIQDKDGVRYFTTRGDANPQADAAEISLPPTAWRVVFSLPVLGYMIGWATQPLGTLTLIVIPLLGLAGLKLADVFKKLRPAFFMPAPRNA